MMTIFSKKWGSDTKKEISLLFVTDNFIKKLNAKYRNKNKPTDVLSFPVDLEEGWKHVGTIGDVVVSVETAKRQAKDKGHSFEDELKFLLIHGFLHLIGYDHEVSLKEERRMKRQEREYWKLLEDC